MVAGDIRQYLDAKEKDQFDKMIKISTDQNPAIRYLYQ